MPEQPQWSERTLDMPPQDPWAEAPTTPGHHAGHHAGPPTAPLPPAAPAPAPSPFSQGRARVNPQEQRRHVADHEPTGTGWPGAEPPGPTDTSVIGPWREIRAGGGEWTTAAVLFLFVSWGIWALSEGGPLGTPVIVFLVTLAVAAGVFCLSRLIGHLVLERQMGRSRRSARGSHVVTAVFVAGVGVGHLQQTEWVMDAYHWVAGLFS